MDPKTLPLKSSADESIYISPEGLTRLAALFDPKEPNKNIVWTTDNRIELPILVRNEGSGIFTTYILLSYLLRL